MTTKAEPKIVEIKCNKGTAKIKRGATNTLILCNRRRKWDVFRWSWAWDNSEIQLMGLHRGRYGDAKAKTEDVLAALRSIGDERMVKRIEDSIERKAADE